MSKFMVFGVENIIVIFLGKGGVGKLIIVGMCYGRIVWYCGFLI